MQQAGRLIKNVCLFLENYRQKEEHWNMQRQHERKREREREREKEREKERERERERERTLGGLFTQKWPVFASISPFL
jgi:hypothetical protein